MSKLICTFKAPNQLCGHMLVNSGEDSRERCSLSKGACEHQQGNAAQLEKLIDDMQEQAEIAEVSGDNKVFQLLDIAAYELRILMNRATIEDAKT